MLLEPRDLLPLVVLARAAAAVLVLVGLGGAALGGAAVVHQLQKPAEMHASR